MSVPHDESIQEQQRTSEPASTYSWGDLATSLRSTIQIAEDSLQYAKLLFLITTIILYFWVGLWPRHDDPFYWTVMVSLLAMVLYFQVVKRDISGRIRDWHDLVDAYERLQQVKDGLSAIRSDIHVDYQNLEALVIQTLEEKDRLVEAQLSDLIVMLASSMESHGGGARPPQWRTHGAIACIEWYLRYAEPKGVSQAAAAEQVGISLRQFQRELGRHRDRMGES